MVGCPSPRKDDNTQKAEQVSWLAAHLTLCAFPSFDKPFDELRVVSLSNHSGQWPCRFQRRSQLRGSNGFSLASPGEDGIGGIHHFPLGSPRKGPLSLAYSIVLAKPPLNETTTTDF